MFTNFKFQRFRSQNTWWKIQLKQPDEASRNPRRVSVYLDIFSCWHSLPDRVKTCGKTVELTAFLCSEGCLSFRGKYDWSKPKIGLNTLKDANYTPFNRSELIRNVHANNLISDFTRQPEVLLQEENPPEFPPHFTPFQVSGNFITLSVSILCVESLHLFGPKWPADWSLSSRRQPPLRLFDTGNLFVLGAGLLTDALLRCRPRFVPRVALLTVTRSHSSFRACACIGWQQLHWPGGRFKRVKDMNMVLNLKSHDARGIFHVCLILFNQFLFQFVCLMRKSNHL